ncbi:hypothetical protein AB0F81_26990 [Actinoplanes sp. NPDC024001]|uniref:hypothetical protein n=1 Tax=Actinoplanes sp. NPDC024001 TaxID=3154598 RepID=UPI0033E90A3F
MSVRRWIVGCLVLAALQGCAAEPAPPPPWTGIGGTCPKVTAPAFAEIGVGILDWTNLSDATYTVHCRYGEEDAPAAFGVQFSINRNNRRYTHKEVEMMVGRPEEEDGWVGAVELPDVGVPAVGFLEEKIGIRAWSENAMVTAGFSNLPEEMATLDSRADDLTALLTDLLAGLRR